MGVVYAAEHLELGRPCAVKVIRGPMESTSGPATTQRVIRARPAAQDAAHRRACRLAPSSEQPRGDVLDAVARFRMEARAASRLDHPNVMRVLDFGRDHDDDDDLYYLVTEQLEGKDLIDVLNAHALLPLPRAIDIARQLCAALAHAHERGVVHRDIKPENLRLVRREADDGRLVEIVKLLDFGTAQIDGVTAGTLVIGTPAYMSPEQAAGAPVDHRSDLYSCGVLLFEMVTGRLPFERGSATELAAAHLGSRPPLPSAINPDVDREVESIVLWCLRKRPAERPQSAREVREALDRIVRRTARRLPTGTIAEAPARTRADRWAGTTTVRERVSTRPPWLERHGSRSARRRASAPTLLTLLAAAGVASAAWLAIGSGSPTVNAPSPSERFESREELLPPSRSSEPRPAAPPATVEPPRELAPRVVSPATPQGHAAAEPARRRATRRAQAVSPAGDPKSAPVVEVEDDDPYRDLGTTAPLARLDGSGAAAAPAATGGSTEAERTKAPANASSNESSPAWDEPPGRGEPTSRGAAASEGRE
jgi:serine/threonine-protein kinase